MTTIEYSQDGGTSWSEFDYEEWVVTRGLGLNILAPIAELETTKETDIIANDLVRITTNSTVVFEGHAKSSGTKERDGTKEYELRGYGYELSDEKITFDVTATAPEDIISNQILNGTDYTLDAVATEQSIDYKAKNKKIKAILKDLCEIAGYIFKFKPDKTLRFEPRGWENATFDTAIDDGVVQEVESGDIGTVRNKVEVVGTGADSPASATVEDTTSIDRYGEQSQTYRYKSISTLTDAENLAEKLINAEPADVATLVLLKDSYTVNNIANYIFELYDTAFELTGDEFLVTEQQITEGSNILTVGLSDYFGQTAAKRQEWSDEEKAEEGADNTQENPQDYSWVTGTKPDADATRNEVYIQNSEPTGGTYEQGDIWYKNDTFEYYLYDASTTSWEKASDITSEWGQTPDWLTAEISATHIGENEIETPLLQSNAVTTDIIDAGAVDTEQLSAHAVEANKITAGAVSTPKINLNDDSEIGTFNEGMLWYDDTNEYLKFKTALDIWTIEYGSNVTRDHADDVFEYVQETEPSNPQAGQMWMQPNADDPDTQPILYRFKPTVTYQSTGKTVVDISDVDSLTIDYINGAGGSDTSNSGGSGGRVEDVMVDVSSEDYLYVWVATQPDGRYDGEKGASGNDGGGSTEISFSNTDSADSSDEPVIAGAGGGGGAYEEIEGNDGGDGARGRAAEGTGDPQGGSGGTSGDGGDGQGYIDSRSIISGGSTTTGGGSSGGNDGEIQITYDGIHGIWEEIATYGSAWSDTLDDGNAPENNAGNAVRSSVNLSQDPSFSTEYLNDTDHDKFISTDVYLSIVCDDSSTVRARIIVELYDPDTESWVEHAKAEINHSPVSGQDTPGMIINNQQMSFVVPKEYSWRYRKDNTGESSTRLEKEHEYELYSAKA